LLSPLRFDYITFFVDITDAAQEHARLAADILHARGSKLGM
jgi:hypothetical protein